MDKRMTLAEAKAWLGDRWLLAKPVERITHGPTPPYLEKPLPSLLRPQGLARREAA